MTAPLALWPSKQQRGKAMFKRRGDWLEPCVVCGSRRHLLQRRLHFRLVRGVLDHHGQPLFVRTCPHHSNTTIDAALGVPVELLQ